MKRFELSIHISDKKYIDSLIISLVRQGYEVYYNEDESVVCCHINEEDLKNV